MVLSSRLHGLHHVAQKLTMIGFPSFWISDDCTVRPSKVLIEIFSGSVLTFCAKTPQVRATAAMVKRNFFIRLCVLDLFIIFFISIEFDNVDLLYIFDSRGKEHLCELYNAVLIFRIGYSGKLSDCFLGFLFNIFLSLL